MVKVVAAGRVAPEVGVEAWGVRVSSSASARSAALTSIHRRTYVSLDEETPHLEPPHTSSILTRRLGRGSNSPCGRLWRLEFGRWLCSVSYSAGVSIPSAEWRRLRFVGDLEILEDRVSEFQAGAPAFAVQ